MGGDMHGARGTLKSRDPLRQARGVSRDDWAGAESAGASGAAGATGGAARSRQIHRGRDPPREAAGGYARWSHQPLQVCSTSTSQSLLQHTGPRAYLKIASSSTQTRSAIGPLTVLHTGSSLGKDSSLLWLVALLSVLHQGNMQRISEY